MKPTTSFLGAAMTGLLSLGAVNPAHALPIAAVYDVISDFSSTTNPTGIWSYGWEAGLGQSFHLHESESFHYPDGSEGILWGGAANVGVVWINPTASYHYAVAPGEVSMHPGINGEFSVIRWTSPVDGEASIDGYFGSGDYGIMSYFITHNDSPIFEMRYTYGNGLFTITESIAKGDTIDFIVGEGYYGGNTPLHATIRTAVSVPEPTLVPEPASMLLLSAGLVTLIGIRKKLNVIV